MTAPPFNPLVAALTPPPIPSIQAWAKDYDGRLGPLIDLSQAVPGYPPHPRLLTALGAASASASNAGYGPIEGEPALRAAYAAELSAIYGGKVDAGEVHITAGCNQAFAAAMLALIGPGERVALPSPFYFNHRTTLAMLGIDWVGVDCRADRGFVPMLEDIDKALGAHESGRQKPVRALVLITPNNPTGAIYPAQLVRGIFELCRQRDVWLLVDETYRDFLPAESASPAPHDLFSSAPWRDNLVALYSFSKSYCIPGHRVGALTASRAVVAQVAKVMDNLQICAPRAPQVALAQCAGELATWRRANREEIAQRAQNFRQAMFAAPGWQLDAIGAYFAYVKHPFKQAGSEQAAQRVAREAGVLCLPGSYFGQGQEAHLRMAFANAGPSTIALLAERLRTVAA